MTNFSSKQQDEAISLSDSCSALSLQTQEQETPEDNYTTEVRSPQRAASPPDRNTPQQQHPTRQMGDNVSEQIPDVVLSLEDSHERQDEHTTTQNQSRGSTNGSPQQQHPNQQENDDDGSDNAPDKPRRSKRKPKERRFLLSQILVERNRVIASKFDVRGGIDQPGRNYVRDKEEKQRREEEQNGKEIYDYYLKPAGWKSVPCHKLNSSFAFLAKGETKETAIDGETKFNSYEDIWKKWDSDKEFRETYMNDSDKEYEPRRDKIFSPDRIGRDYPASPLSSCPDSDSDEQGKKKLSKDHDTHKKSQKPSPRISNKKEIKKKPPTEKKPSEVAQEEVSLAHSASHRHSYLFGEDTDSGREHDPFSPSSLGDRLGRPTPGVPTAAGWTTNSSQRKRAKTIATTVNRATKPPVVLRLKKGCCPNFFPSPTKASPQASKKRAPSTKSNQNGPRKQLRNSPRSRPNDTHPVTSKKSPPPTSTKPTRSQVENHDAKSVDASSIVFANEPKDDSFPSIVHIPTMPSHDFGTKQDKANTKAASVDASTKRRARASSPVASPLLESPPAAAAAAAALQEQQPTRTPQRLSARQQQQMDDVNFELMLVEKQLEVARKKQELKKLLDQD